MEVRAIHLQNFKRLRDKRLDFTDPETGHARNLVVLAGVNGSGKSTILQAIAATLGTATGRLNLPGDLAWPGFDLSLAGNAWAMPYEATLEVGFSAEERDATIEFFGKVPGLADRDDIIRPSRDSTVELRLGQGTVRANTSAQYFQCRGREYAKQVVKIAEEGYGVFAKVGTIFWYTEHRTATSLTGENENGEPLQYDMDLLRRRLADYMGFHARVTREEYDLRPGQRDFFGELANTFETVFPDRRFEGAVPRSEIDEILKEPWFFLYDGAHQYEISEMSAGERAIFPILFDFANWNINYSVVLIDELELHLHPPLQQALIRALPNLGKGNQFVITTHSDHVSEMVPRECVYHLEEQS